MDVLLRHFQDLFDGSFDIETRLVLEQSIRCWSNRNGKNQTDKIMLRCTLDSHPFVFMCKGPLTFPMKLFAKMRKVHLSQGHWSANRSRSPRTDYFHRHREKGTFRRLSTKLIVDDFSIVANSSHLNRYSVFSCGIHETRTSTIFEIDGCES